MNLALEVAARSPAEPTAFAELTAGVFWKPGEMIAMLWGYFDESGEHGPSGELLALTIGGLIAPLEAWQAFDEEWGKALACEGITFFHRSEVGSGRDDRFLRIIGEHVGLALGFTAATAGRAAETYEISFVDCLVQLANASASADAISVVLAKHPEFHGSRGEGYRNLINWGDARLDEIAFGDPKRLRPLQAADLVAHAVRRSDQVERLKKFGCQVFLYMNGRPAR